MEDTLSTKQEYHNIFAGDFVTISDGGDAFGVTVIQVSTWRSPVSARTAV